MMRTRRSKARPEEAKENREPVYKKSCFGIYKALSLVVLGSSILSINSAIVKSATTISTAELSLVRYIGMFVMNLPFVLGGEKKKLFKKANLLALVLRGVFGFLCLYLSFAAMRLMPIAESSVILSTSLVWVMLLSRIFLKENLDVLNTISIVLSVTGLVLMSRVFVFIFSSPGEKYKEWNYWFGCLLSLLSAVTSAFTYVFLRKLKDIHESVSIAYLSVIGVTGSTVVLLLVRKVEIPACGFDGVKIMLLGVFAFLGQFCVTSALRYEKAGAVSSVRTSSRVCMIFLLQIVLFGETPDVYSILAAIAVLASLWLSGLRKYFQEKRRKVEAKAKSSQPNHEESAV